jgi:uncharacterized membrane protein
MLLYGLACTALKMRDAARDTMLFAKTHYFTTPTPVPSLPKMILAVIGVVAYIVLMYASAIGPDAAARTVVLTVLAWQGFAVAILWGSGKRALALLVAAPATLLFVYFDELKHLEWLCLVPNILVNGSLFLFFARTLRGTKTALITNLALRVHGSIPDPIRAYTRALTYMWSAFFLISIVASLTLYFFVSFEAWSLFTNVYALPIMLSVFALEYLYRRLRFPWFEHVSIMAGIKAFTSLGDSKKPSTVPVPDPVKTP